MSGHLEGDLIIGGGNKSAIGTLVDRCTRTTKLVHLPNGKDAEQMRASLTEKAASLPDALKLTLTWDQGSEMAHHDQFTDGSGIPVYFCDPHSPWQRPSNENTNGLPRQYFPKGTDLSVYTTEDLDAVETELNNRPRKTLGWRSPAQVLATLSQATTTRVLRRSPESAPAQWGQMGLSFSGAFIFERRTRSSPPSPPCGYALK